MVPESGCECEADREVEVEVKFTVSVTVGVVGIGVKVVLLCDRIYHRITFVDVVVVSLVMNPSDIR